MLERLNQAMEHIERHLDQDVEVEEPARIAATSEYHLRRMFSALADKHDGRRSLCAPFRLCTACRSRSGMEG